MRKSLSLYQTDRRQRRYWRLTPGASQEPESDEFRGGIAVEEEDVEEVGVAWETDLLYCERYSPSAAEEDALLTEYTVAQCPRCGQADVKLVAIRNG